LSQRLLPLRHDKQAARAFVGALIWDSMDDGYIGMVSLLLEMREELRIIAACILDARLVQLTLAHLDSPMLGLACDN
jgi:hypothetical protein